MLKYISVISILLFLFSCSGKLKPAAEIPLSVNDFGGKFWKDTDRSANPTLGCPGRVMPLSYRMLDTDYEGLRKLLLPGKSGLNLDTVVLSFPLPEGGWEDYSLTQVQVMPPDLADKYPDIKTWAGKSNVFSADNMRLDIAPKGVSIMILSTRGTIVMDPFCGFDSLHVISYYKKNLPGDMKPQFEK